MFKIFTVRSTADEACKWGDVTFNLNHIVKVTYHPKTIIHLENEHFEVHGKPSPKLMEEMLKS